MSDWRCYYCKDAFVPIYATPCSKCVDGNGFTPLYATPCGKLEDIDSAPTVIEAEGSENHEHID